MISKADFMWWLVGAPLIVGVLCFAFGYVFATYRKEDHALDESDRPRRDDDR
jgi:hypothetical protein